MGIPVALESSLALSATAGRRRADRPLPRGRATRRRSDALLAHLRLDPSLTPAAVDTVEARIRRGDAATVERGDRALGAAAAPPAAAARGRDPGAAPPSARPQRPRARRGARTASGRRSPGAGEVPFSALELRGGGRRGRAARPSSPGSPGCPAASVPELAGAIEAIESSSVPLWRGPATGRVRILDPYRVRAARARALFCLSLQDGVFPSAAPPGPAALRGAAPRDRQPRSAPHRSGRRGALPVPLLRLAADRPPLPELAGMRRGRHRRWRARRSSTRSATCSSPTRARRRARSASAAPSARCRRSTRRPASATLARALALGGWAFEREPVLAAAGARGERAADRRRCSPSSRTRTCARARSARPRCSPTSATASVFSANSLEGWVDLLVQVVRRARAHPAAARARPPTRCGSGRSSTTRSTGSTREPPGRRLDPAPGDVERWQRALRRAARRGRRRARAGPLNHARRAALDARPGPGRGVPRRGGRDRDRAPPRPDLLEVAFGRFEDEDGPQREPLRASAMSRCAGGSTGSTSTTTGARRRPRLQDRQERLRGGQVHRARASCRSSSTCGSPSGSSASTPVGGLYHPLGAVGDRRKPRGLVAREDDEP